MASLFLGEYVSPEMGCQIIIHATSTFRHFSLTCNTVGQGELARFLDL